MDIDCQSIRYCDLEEFSVMIENILSDRRPPKNDFFKSVVKCALETYCYEDENIRAKDDNGLPGGVLDLRGDKHIIIVPDLHARRYFMKNLLSFKPNLSLSSMIPSQIDPTLDLELSQEFSADVDDDIDESDILQDEEQMSKQTTEQVDEEMLVTVQDENVAEQTENESAETILELLENDKLTVLCLGDGVHGEASFAQRWFDAYNEYLNSFAVCPNMDDEIADSFNLMIVVMLLKVRYPNSFHFLKGNHENIANETADGNYAFAKFANEGQMVLTYFRLNYDAELLDLYYRFEKALPLFAVGKNFLASHAQPLTFYDYEEILNYRSDGEVVCGLTWTDNYQSVAGTIDEMLDYYIPENDEHTYYFAGHRPIKGLYYCIDNNRFVQIHNPRKQIICQVDQNVDIELSRDVFELFVEDK